MEPRYINGNVASRCPDCNGAVSTFEFISAQSGEYGTIVLKEKHNYDDTTYSRILYKLLSCAGCGRGAITKIH